MALQGSVSTNKYNDPEYGERVGMTCTWTGTQDKARNITTVNWTLASDGSKDFEYYTGNVSLIIGGITVLSIVSRFLMQGGGRWSRSGTVEIAHNADGSKDMTVEIRAGIWAYGTVNCTGSETFALDRIPRASAVSVPNVTMGTAVTVSLSRASETFLHDLTVLMDGTEYPIAEQVGASFSWTAEPEIWAPRITDAMQKTCILRAVTWDGETQLGSSEAEFLLFVPATAVPVITGFSAEIRNDNAVAAGWGVAVKGFSRIRWSATAEGVLGADVRAYAFSAGAAQGDGQTGQTAILQQAGEILPTIKITDSRGQTASWTAEPVMVYDHGAPTLAGAAAYRCTADGTEDGGGTYVRLELAAECSPIGGNNSAAMWYAVKTPGGTYGARSSLTSGAVVSGFLADQSYVIALGATDALGAEKSVEITVETAEASFHLKDGGRGAAFGAYAEEENLLDNHWNTRLRGEIRMDKPYFTKEDGETEWLFPPMEAGVEYRTAERFLGRPVYRKLVAHQFPSGLSGSQSLKIPHGITGLEMALRVEQISSGYVFPYVTGTTSLVVTACDGSEITLTNAGSLWSNTARIWYFDISYLKEEAV